MPVRLGLAESFAHPGGNVTGFLMTADQEILGKRLQLLRDAVPGITRVGIMANPDSAGDAAELRTWWTSARARSSSYFRAGVITSRRRKALMFDRASKRRPTVRALISIGQNWEAGASVGSVPMRDLAAAADRIDNWIRWRVIVSCCGTQPSQSNKLNSTRHGRLGLSAIGQSLKDQYDALATPIPRISLHSSNNLKRRPAGASRPDRAY
jgi:hypothetical protein